MNANFLATTTLVDELARSGIRHVCISPGSRSTPLTLAFAAHPHIQSHVHLDERSAAFFALGLALATDVPVALVCTSGSAAVNYFPAIVEAHLSRVPLIVLTADRPHELRDSGANQTMDQVKLFGSFALWSVDMAIPEAVPEALTMRNIRTLAARATAVASGARAGVVHINLPFRKPLEPDAEAYARWRDGNSPSTAPLTRPHTCVTRGISTLEAGDLGELERLIAAHPRGVIVCGPRCPGGAFARSVVSLGACTGYPVLADPISGVRFAEQDSISVYDEWLSLNPKTTAPDLVIRFGDVPTSAALCAWLANPTIAHHVQVSAGGHWADDDHRTTWQIDAEPEAVCMQLGRQLGIRQQYDQWTMDWRLREQGGCARASDQWRARAQSTEPLFDGEAIARLQCAIPAGANVFVGNSLAIRHVDQYWMNADAAIHVYGSRGASGIDGNVSTALGIAAANPDTPMFVILGDITLYHDMNGLLALRQMTRHNVTIVVVNNNGGGIFRRLPVAAIETVFENYFLTPHNLDFSLVAQLYGLPFGRVDTRAGLERELTAPGFGRVGRMIEIQTDSAVDMRERKLMMTAIH